MSEGDKRATVREVRPKDRRRRWPRPRALPDPEDYGLAVYDSVQPFAFVAKTVLQMLVGAAGVVGLGCVIAGWSPRFISDTHTTTTVVRHGVTKITTTHFHVSMAHRCLAVIGTALIVAAGLELAYTLYTHGPDEAVDPLILALAAGLILQLASADRLDEHQAVAMVLYTVALIGLFALRQVVVKRTESEARKSRQERQELRRSRGDTGTADPETAGAEPTEG